VARDAKPGDPPLTPPKGAVTWRGHNVARLVYTWSEHSLLRNEVVSKAPDDAPPDVTCIIGCAVMTGAGAAINTADVKRGQPAAVIGVGGVGLSCIAGLNVRGANPLIAIDLDDSKLELARRFGATHGVNAASSDALQEVIRITNRGETDRRGNPVSGLDYAFDCIGKPQTMKQAIAIVRPGQTTIRPGGTAVLVGIADEEVTFNANEMLMAEKRLISSWGGSCRPDRDFPEFMRWYREGQLDLAALVTTRVKLDDINDAVDALRRGEVLGRSVIEF
jgi:Zn-dependent alcohol dehydrogenase